MSWQEAINQGLIITTGDGKVYRPIYSMSPRTTEFNMAEFDFPNIRGTLAVKSEARGRRYTMDFYFQGDDHLDVSSEFEKSSYDKRPWIVEHPMHGVMVMQASSITYDNTGLNVTKITAQLIETLSEIAPKQSTVPQNQIAIDVENFGTTSDESFEARLKDGSLSINGLTLNMLGIYDETATIKKSEIQANEYFNLFNKANALILDITAEPLLAIQAVKDVIMYPSLFEVSVKDRINMILEQYQSLVDGITELITPDEKLIFENNAGNLVASMVQAVSNPFDDNDYGNMVDVLSTIDILADFFNEFLTDLDGLQTDNNGDTDSYIPDYDVISSLSGVVNYTIASLFEIALGAKQERIVVLEHDDNLINLTHRFYGLVEDDSTIDEFIRNNQIGLNELLLIKKGREIKYYV